MWSEREVEEDERVEDRLRQLEGVWRGGEGWGGWTGVITVPTTTRQ